MPIERNGFHEAPSNPTVNDDRSKGFRKRVCWLNTTTGRVFTLIDPTVGAAVWKKDTVWDQTGFPQKITSGGSWKHVGYFRFHGSDSVGTPKSIKVIGGVVDVGAVCGIRIYDVDNAKVIAKRLDITSTNPKSVNISGGISNVPTGNAVWEVQVKRVSGGSSLQVAAGSVSLKFADD